MKIDSTLGFPDIIGFRCGTGFKYFLYDFENEKQSLIKELPLIVMDSSLLYMYCKNNSSCFRKNCIDFIDSNRFNTHITFNFHNTTFDRSLKSRTGMINIYSELITYISNFNLKNNPSFFKNKVKKSIFFYTILKKDYIFVQIRLHVFHKWVYLI